MKTTLIAFVAFVLFPGAAAGDYIIGEGDVLFISVWGEEEMSLPLRVRPDGKITLPALGEVTAAGLTPGELQVKLSEKLGSIIKEPAVTVIVQEITNNKVYVFGGGVKAGVYNLVRRTTLLQLLCQISELEGADLRASYVLRDGSKLDVDFYRLFIEGDVSLDVPIEPEDVIFMPVAGERSVYVVGAVNRPTSVKFREGLTVMEAILEAGGFTKFAKRNSILIHRKDGGKEVSLKVRAKDLMEDGDLKQNMRLMPGDHVFVKQGVF